MKHTSAAVVLLSFVLIASALGAILPFNSSDSTQSVYHTNAGVISDSHVNGNISASGNVTFNFNGLPSNTSVRLQVNGIIGTTSSGKLKIALPYGNYSYAAVNERGYVSPNWTGHFYLHSIGLVIDVNYTGIPFQSSGLTLNNGSSFSIYSHADSNNATPLNSVFDNSNGKIYAITSFPQGFYIIGNSSEQFIHTSGQPEDIAVVQSSGDLAVAENSSVFIYSPDGTIVNSLNVPFQPNAILFDNFTNTLWLGTDSGIYVLNASTLSSVSQIDGINIQIPGQMALDTINGSVFALNVSSNYSENYLFTISGNYKISSSNSLGSFAGEVAFLPEYNRVYVSTISQEQNTLFYLGDGILHPVNGSSGAYSVGYLGVLNSIYFINELGDIYLINPMNSSLVQIMKSSTLPNLLMDGLNDTYTMLSTQNGVISYTGIGGKVYNLTFKEHGLTAGTEWSVSVDNYTENSSGSSITFFETAGPFSAYFNTTSHYSYKRSISLNLSTSTLVNISFIKLYSLLINSIGMPQNSYLNITIAGNHINTSMSHYVLYLVNGTYNYSAQASSGYLISPNNGTIVIDGSDRIINLTWALYTYEFVIEEIGLPSGIHWSIYLGGVQYSSSNNVIEVNLSNGSYSLAVGYVPGYFALPYPSQFNISGKNANLNIDFKQTKFNLSFEIKNYTGEYPLIVSLSSLRLQENSSNFSVMVPNGSYRFSIVFPGNVWKKVDGIVNISDSGKNVIVVAEKQFYSISVHESGLPAGTLWGFNLSGILISGNTSVLSERVTNGTYTVNPVLVNGYEPVMPETVIINGSSETLDVSYVPLPVLYNVTFIPIGLPPGFDIQISIGDLSQMSSGVSPAQFSLANGTYNFTVNYSFPPGPPLPPPAMHPMPVGPFGNFHNYSQTLQFTVNGSNEFVFLLFVQGQIVLSFTVPVVPPPLPPGPGPLQGPHGPGMGIGPGPWTNDRNHIRHLPVNPKF